MRLAERVALITGAAGGIGSAVARRFSREGAVVALADRAAPDALQKDIEAAGGEALAIATDVTNSADVHAMVERTLARFGRLDILVNVAGIVSTGSAETLPESEWDRVIDINLKGTFLACQAVIPCMRFRRYGRIINLGSVLGKNGGNPRPWIDRAEQEKAGNVAYGVSKAGVHAMTWYLAKELAADNITVNAIAPGPVASAMTTNFPETLKRLIPAGRMGSTDDVAEAALFLAAETTSFITGEVLDVNGGMWCD
jgi:3-oxoacyl-[acyl-carrier protein] reductase